MVCPTSWVNFLIGGNVRTQSWLGQLEEFKRGNNYAASRTVDDEGGRMIASVLEVKKEIPV
jgi:hypothetical protein